MGKRFRLFGSRRKKNTQCLSLESIDIMTTRMMSSSLVASRSKERRFRPFPYLVILHSLRVASSYPKNKINSQNSDSHFAKNVVLRWSLEDGGDRLIKTVVDLHGGEEENLIDINISPARKCHSEGYIRLIHRTDIEVEGE
ncbi:hypothetical protein EUGRSUZ_E03695 [Eucalyptus grandis]|uniref:Uncharacterized protein n=2 Tax=Eucalyptus grandis TaxID=71139 RepID=A0ACC3KZ27_EUCGR|nr:hypothetical protein EUGRSUZ_E03695 [Eucalyptus grandis]